MKRIISSLLAMAMILGSVSIVSAEDSTEKVFGATVQTNPAVLKETSTYGHTTKDELLAGGNVQTITIENSTEISIGKHNDRYTVKYLGGESGNDVIEIQPGDKVKADKIYVDFMDECKDTLYISNYVDGGLNSGTSVDVQCDFEDARVKPVLRDLRVNNQVITGFSKDKNEYTIATTEARIPTIMCDTEYSSDTYEILSDKNVIYIVVFNKNKTKSNVYKINVNYNIDGELKIEVGDNLKTGDYLSYSLKVGNSMVNDLSNVTLVADDNNNHGVVYSDKIYLLYPGKVTIRANFNGKETEKEIEITGDSYYDVPDYNFNISDLTELTVGNVVTARFESGLFKDDPRISVESASSNVIVAGKQLLAVKDGEATINATHLTRGEIIKDKKINCKLEKDIKCSEVSFKNNTINIRPQDKVLLDIESGDAVDTTKTLEVTSGETRIQLDGAVVTALGLGKATIEVKCGDAVSSIDINIISQDVVVPTEMIYKLPEKVYIGYDNELTVSFNPEGASVSGSDLILTPSTSGVKIGKKDEFTFTFNPSTIGDVIMTLSCDKYNLKQEIKVVAEDGGHTTKIDVTKIVLETTSISIEEGNSKRIYVSKVLPEDATDKSVKYESVDTKIAEVDENGRVTANRRGSTKINVYSVSNPTVYTTCYVNVYRDSGYDDDRYDKDYRYPVDRVEIRLEDSKGTEKTIRNGKVEVMANSEQQFTARIYPYNATNQEVRWYTSDDNIAEVDDDGLLTTYRQGEVTLSVVTRDGNHRDSVKVKVTEWIQKPTKITIVNDDNTPVNTEVKTGDQLSLKVDFEPLLTTERNVVWTITEGHGLFTVDSMGNVQFNDVGKATIKVYAKDYSVYDTVTFNIKYSEEYWAGIGSDKGVSPKRAILIDFSEPLSKASIVSGAVFVAKDLAGNEKVDTAALEIVGDGSVLRVSSTTGMWDNDTTYYVFIRGNCMNDRGVKLIKNCRYEFKTRKVHQR